MKKTAHPALNDYTLKDNDGRAIKPSGRFSDMAWAGDDRQPAREARVS